MYIYRVLYYSVIRRHEIPLCASTWISLENGIETELNQAEKDTFRTLPLTRGAGNKQIRRDGKQRRSWGGGWRGVTL